MTKPTLQEIDTAVCDRFKLFPGLIRARVKRRSIVRPRQIAMYLARNLTGLSYPKLGVHFGRDHTTIIVGVRRIAGLVQTNPKVAGYVAELEAILAPSEVREAA